MYTVAQKSLDATFLLLKMECELTFEELCITLLRLTTPTGVVPHR